MYWRSQHLIVEFDGRAYHSTRAAFERDRAKDADLLLAGERVMRITRRQIARHPNDLAARFAAALSTAGSRRMPLVN
jgi:very-short-patch-repair endonuclease